MLRRIRTSALAIAAISLLTAVAMAAANPQLPDWAREAAARPQKTYDSRTNAVVLLSEDTVTVTRSGEYIETVRKVLRILRPEGKDEGTISIEIDSGSKLLNAHAWGSSPDGHNYELREKEFLQVGIPGAGELYNDSFYYKGQVPGSNPGAVIAFEYTVRNHAWGDYTEWDVQENIPVEETHFRLELPEGWNHQSSWMNTAPVAPVGGNGNRQWSWVVRDVAPFDTEEKYTPTSRALKIRMQVAFSPPEFQKPVFAEWSSIGKWSEDLVQPRRDPSPEITAKVQLLTAEVSDFDGIVSRLADFMQREIRYVAIEIGLGGWQPHAAGDVYRNRYGDCKDKATLLASMLQVKGIRSRNVPIYANHGVTREDSPGNAFNHQILAIELPANWAGAYKSVVQSKSGKRYLIFDPTNEWIPIGDLPEYEQGNFALLAGKDGGELIRLPVFPPERNRLTRAGKFTISESGGLSGELDVNSNGSHAWQSRARIKHESELERTKGAEYFLTRFVQGAALKQATYENLDQLGRDLMVHYSFSAPSYLKNSGPLLLFQPCVFGHKAMPIDWKKRKYPVDMESTSQELDSYEITLPPGLEVDDLPDPVQVDVGFASYRSSVTSAKGIVAYQREYIVRDPQVPLEKLGQLRKLEEAIMRDESSSVVLKKKN